MVSTTPSITTTNSHPSKSQSGNTRVYSRKYERNYEYYSDCNRDDQSKSLWRRVKELVRNQRDSYWQRWDNWKRYSLHGDNTRRRLSVRNSNQISRYQRFSSDGKHRHQQNNKHYGYYYLLIGLLTIGLPVRAEGDETINNAAPQSTATGNVTNQAVQFQNNGAPTRQQYGGGVVCNGPTMTFSPFWLASENKPYEPESYSRGWNYGAQLNFMVPLDYSTVERCKSIARRVEEKMRVDYELVRSIKCAELMQKGFTLRPGSRVAHMCSDVVPIVSVLKQQTTKTK